MHDARGDQVWSVPTRVVGAVVYEGPVPGGEIETVAWGVEAGEGRSRAPGRSRAEMSSTAMMPSGREEGFLVVVVFIGGCGVACRPGREETRRRRANRHF